MQKPVVSVDEFVQGERHETGWAEEAPVSSKAWAVVPPTCNGSVWLTQYSHVRRPREDGDGVCFHWPGSGMRVAVTVAPGTPDASEAIEVRSERRLVLPEGPHPVLGAVFRQLGRPQPTR